MHSHILHRAAHAFYVCSPGQHHTTGQGGAEQLVAAYRNTVYASIETVGLRLRHKGENHAA